ncbi:MAG: S8 family serine peptidase [Parasporobacterium sp.]|nr:S8 family serine peptidase [Parasporobacterium sp.]
MKGSELMKKVTGRMLAGILGCVMIFGLTFSVSAEELTVSVPEWASEIPSMLSAGNYAEGEAVAGVIFRNMRKPGTELLAESEMIMDVTEAEEDLISGMAPEDGELHIVYIQRDDLSTEEILNRLAKDRRVLFAEPNYLGEKETASEMREEGNSETAFGTDFTVRTENLEDLTAQQWSSSDQSEFHLEGNDSNSVHVPGFDEQTANMPGDPVIVAVSDYPVDFSHPDLAPVAYTFSKEQQLALGCDVHGFNATSESTDGRLQYWDEAVHGTHCAGIIGAAWDGKGISGIASNVKLISIQNATENGRTSLVNNLRGMDFIDRANEMGCNISINSNSWGNLQDSRALNAAVLALGEKWGVLSVFAAANDSRDLSFTGIMDNTLSDNPYAILVAATDSAGNLAPYSNYGSTAVDLAAPGSGILSTIIVNRKMAQFFADAIPETERKFYEGFEKADTALKATWIKGGTLMPTEASVTDQSHFAGTHGLKVSINQDAKEGESYLLDYYSLRLDFGDLSGKEIAPGDLMGFVLGGKGYLEAGAFRVLNTEGEMEWLPAGSDSSANQWALSDSNGWVSLFLQIPEDADLSHFIVELYLDVSPDMDSVYLDSVGFGTEAVPYAINDGTSMACPAVSGMAAVLKAQNPDVNGAELKTLVKAKVRKLPSLEGLTKTGGMIDFNADAYSPSIQNLIISGQNITVFGSNFTENGTVQVLKRIAGAEPEVKEASVISWSDHKVTLNLAERTEGIVEVVLTNKDGKQDSFTRFVSKSENLYEEDLPFDKTTGEPLIFDSGGDYETNGPLVGLGDKLYYLPCLTMTERTPANKDFRCFDTAAQTWSELPSLPEYLEYVSAAATDGKIIVKGFTMKLAPDGSPIEDENAEIRIYVYDTANASWSKGSAEHVDPKDTIACNDGQLILVGGAGDTTVNETSSVRLYDLAKGAGETICSLAGIYYRPQVACKDGVIFVYDVYGYCFERVTDGKTEVLHDALPEYYRSSRSDLYEYSNYQTTERDGVLVPVSEGVLFIGPTAADGSSDTFLLRDGGDKFEPYAKRMSDEKVNFPAAASLRGHVYAIGSVMYEPGQIFFRRTAVETCAESIQGARVVLSASSFTYNGKAQKPVVKTIAGQKLQEGTDYKVTYTNNKNVGTATVTITGKGNYTGTTKTSFTIQPVSIGAATLEYQSKAYTGKALKPAAAVKAKVDGKVKTLKAGTDYNITYTNNKNVGTATVTITGKGNYKGTLTRNFKITKAANNISKVAPASKTLKYSALKNQAQAFKIKATDKFGATMTYAMDSKTSKTVKKYITISRAGKVKVKKGTPKGTYTVKVKVTASGTKNYTAKTVTKSLKIVVK